jgi:hypothetical protein
MSVWAPRPSATPVYSYPATPHQLVANEPLGYRNNAPMPKAPASKCSIVYYILFLVTNELLVGMDDEDLLPCGCEWKLAAVELFVKYRVDCLCRYDHQGNVLVHPHVHNEVSLNILVSNEPFRLLLRSIMLTALLYGRLWNTFKVETSRSS